MQKIFTKTKFLARKKLGKNFLERIAKMNFQEFLIKKKIGQKKINKQ